MSDLERARAVLDAATVAHDAESVERAVAQAAVRIDLALRDENPILLAVLQGGVYFTGRLLPLLRFPLEQASVHVSRYSDGVPGDLIWHARPTLDITDRTVLLVDDVFDEGLTLAALHSDLLQSGARQVYTAVLVNKDVDKKTSFRPDVAALECGDAYLFGCGMDCHGYWRNLPEIYEAAP